MSDPLGRAQAVYPAAARPSDKTTVVVVYALFLAGYVTAGLTTLIGLVMAYVLWGGASELARSHYIFLRHTFWRSLLFSGIGWVVFIIGLPLTLILIGVPLLLLAKLIWVLTAVWFAVRCIVGLLAALDDRPHGQPRTWWL